MAQAMQKAADELRQQAEEQKESKVAKRKRGNGANGETPKRERKPREKKPKKTEGGKDPRMFITNLDGLLVVNKALKLLKKEETLTETESKSVDRLLERIGERLS